LEQTANQLIAKSTNCSSKKKQINSWIGTNCEINWLLKNQRIVVKKVKKFEFVLENRIKTIFAPV
jgi:hypothetical protein